jgi:hypothetical protein
MALPSLVPISFWSATGTPRSTAFFAAKSTPAAAGGDHGNDGPENVSRVSCVSPCSSSPLTTSNARRNTKFDVRGTPQRSLFSDSSTTATAFCGVTRTCVSCLLPFVTRTTHAAWHKPQHFFLCDCKRKVSALYGQTVCLDLGNAQYVPARTATFRAPRLQSPRGSPRSRLFRTPCPRTPPRTRTPRGRAGGTPGQLGTLNARLNTFGEVCPRNRQTPTPARRRRPGRATEATPRPARRRPSPSFRPSCRSPFGHPSARQKCPRRRHPRFRR